MMRAWLRQTAPCPPAWLKWLQDHPDEVVFVASVVITAVVLYYGG